MLNPEQTMERQALLLMFITAQVTLISGYADFPAADYYWPMTATNGSLMADQQETGATADLHGVRFINVRRLEHAAALDGNIQWIDVDAGIIKDCLAFQFSSCNDEQSIALSFWLRLRAGKRIIATGSYTNSSEGPGILIEYHKDVDVLKVDFASPEKHWTVNVTLRRYSWYQVTAAWTIENGLHVVVDGKVDIKNSKDVRGVNKKIKGQPYTKMITIGRPMNIANTKAYGNFDIAHLVVYFRSLADMEMKETPNAALKSGNEKELACCVKKEADECYKNPCLKRSCLNIEKKYTDCFCLGLKHDKCAAFPTTVPPTTTAAPTTTEESSNDCDNVEDDHDLKGCGNTLNDQDEPECNGDLCYYGVCQNTQNSGHCQCPLGCDKKKESPVCGTNGIMYANLCILKNESCMSLRKIELTNKEFCLYPVSKASHYWPFDKWTLNGKTIDKNGDAPTLLHNQVKNSSHSQLGNVLHLRKDAWIDIKRITDKCISQLNCPNGLTVSFWLNFEGGDYIISGGGYAGQPSNPPGFHLQRDPKTKLFLLEVATVTHIWRLHIDDFPRQWLHVAFTWKKNDGLKLYLNGREELSTTTPVALPKNKRNVKIKYSNKIILARYDSARELPQNGKFQIAHLAIWKYALTPKQSWKAYAANVKVGHRDNVHCYKRKRANSVRKTCGRVIYPEEWKKITSSPYICPETDIMEKNRDIKCNQKASTGNSADACYDKDEELCNLLVKKQTGYCSFNTAHELCAASCGYCKVLERKPSTGASYVPQNHISQKTLIFSLLGLFGGLILLLGATVYFWKVYRTRYHGAFVPPVKTVSLLDVSDYEEDKWPSKYIDSATFFIKDVPPKKRALPLIPARITQSNGHRYQPPDYE